MQFTTYSAKETKDFAKKFAQKFLKRGVIIALYGNLGAGKTTFTQGFAKGLRIKEKIISPTFILIRQHKIPNSQKFLYHLDLYRLDNLTESEKQQIKEIISDQKNLVLIEWAEKAKSILPKKTIKVEFKIVNENTRVLKID